jgi:hypothetical protein
MAQTNDPVIVDIIGQLVDRLNEIDGIEFVEDAWLNKAPENYGVVELTGEAGNDWADGRKTAQKLAVNITIYVTGGSHHWITAVQSVLDELQYPYIMPKREYLMDIGKVSWSWTTWIRMPVIRPAEGDA